MTLNEARRVVAVQDCADFGHDLEMLMTWGSWDPIRAVCGRCGVAYRMERV